MRYTWGFCLILGVAFAAASVVLGVLAIGQAGEISAYHHAKACLAGAPPDADCRQTVTGAITGVTEYGGRSADYALDVQTASQTLHARAYRHAPACAGETNLATCTGDFTATVNGVRTDSQGGSNYADVSYVTGDGVINTWARFDGDGTALARAATADENERTPLTIKVWRGSIVGAELGDTWHWAEGNPPGNAIPAAFLTVGFALLLLVMRLRIRRRPALLTQRERRRLMIEDAGQVVAAAGAIGCSRTASGRARSLPW